MIRIGLITHNPELGEALAALGAWGGGDGAELVLNARELDALDGVETLALLFLDAGLADAEKLTALRGKAFRHLAFIGAEPDFEAARLGIRLGIDDYFVQPFCACELSALCVRVGNQDGGKPELENDVVGDLVTLFLRREPRIYEYVDRLCAAGLFRESAREAVEILFRENEWLDLYLNEESCIGAPEEQLDVCRERFVSFFESFVALNPPHTDLLDQIIRYILFNPESDLRQKSLSEEQHINKSYLSTVFTAQTGGRFVDYVTGVKLMRAAWLLRNTDMKIGEIAGRMDYKDIAYFSKQFKKVFHLTPSEYRIPDNYQFSI